MPRVLDNQQAVISKLRGAAKEYDDGEGIRRFSAEAPAPEVSVADILKGIEASQHASKEESVRALAELAMHSRALVQVVVAQQHALQALVAAQNAQQHTSRSFEFFHERDNDGKIERTTVTMR